MMMSAKFVTIIKFANFVPNDEEADDDRGILAYIRIFSVFISGPSMIE